MPNATATDIIVATEKYFTAALRQINKNHLLPPSDTITRKAIIQIDSIFFNAYYALKLQQSPTFKLPKVFTPKPIATPPRVSTSTTQYFISYYARAIDNTMKTAVSVIASSLSTRSWKDLKI